MTYSALASGAKEHLNTGHRHTIVADKSDQILIADPRAKGGCETDIFHVHMTHTCTSPQLQIYYCMQYGDALAAYMYVKYTVYNWWCR